jgi:tetratricopeptide (TPR) repeat protein
MLWITKALGRLHQSLGQLETAADWHRQNLGIAQEMGDPSAQAAAYFEMGELALVTNDYVAAMTTAKVGLAQIEGEEQSARDKTSAGEAASQPPALAPQTLTLVGRGHRLMGAALAMEGSDLPAAQSHLQQAVTAHRLTGNLGDLCATLFELGNVAAQRGELEHALEFYKEAGQAAEAGHVHYFLALAHNNLAYHTLLLGRPQAARQAAEQGLKLAETYGMLGALQYLYSTQGEINLYLGEWAAAAESFQRGLALAEELGHLERQAGYRAGLALAARAHHGDLEGALTLLGEALTLINGHGYWHLRTEIQLWQAETLLLLGRIGEAWPHLDAALATARAHGRTLLMIQGERLRARLLATSGDWPGANTLFSQTLDQATRLDLPFEVARTQAAWGEAALHHSPTPAEGHVLLSKARTTLAAHDARAELQALASTLS